MAVKVELLELSGEALLSNSITGEKCIVKPEGIWICPFCNTPVKIVVKGSVTNLPSGFEYGYFGKSSQNCVEVAVSIIRPPHHFESHGGGCNSQLFETPQDVFETFGIYPRPQGVLWKEMIECLGSITGGEAKGKIFYVIYEEERKAFPVVMARSVDIALDYQDGESWDERYDRRQEMANLIEERFRQSKKEVEKIGE